MNELLIVSALFLMFSLALGLLQVMRGPGSGDRVLATQLVGTAGVGLLLLFSLLLERPGLIDVALVLALLSAVAAAAFTSREQGANDD